jgi:hypothetical protein
MKQTDKKLQEEMKKIKFEMAKMGFKLKEILKENERRRTIKKL